MFCRYSDECIGVHFCLYRVALGRLVDKDDMKNLVVHYKHYRTDADWMQSIRAELFVKTLRRFLPQSDFHMLRPTLSTSIILHIAVHNVFMSSFSK